jgi:tryptophanyl-tRNA synthetase
LQHLEMARDIARSFNSLCGETFVVPEPLIDERVMIVPGIDGQKMSKSYNNYINIFLPEKDLKKVVASIVTDATPLEAPKNPDTCNVFALFSLLASSPQVAEMRDNYLRGGYGYGHAKQALLAVILERFSKERASYNVFMADRALLDEKLLEGAEKARRIAREVLGRVRTRLGY